MNVVIITTKAERYHRHLCAELAERHNVVAVLHPTPKSAPSWPGRMAEHRRQIARHGIVWHLLRKLARNRFRSIGWDVDADTRRCAERFFPDADARYDRLVRPIAHDVAEINGDEGVALLKRFEPDVVICSGGPIYGQPLIDAAGTMLNYHTGISPLYNGSWTVFWTYANGQPDLTGGTLMRMGTTIDGGDVLSHYLPDIEADDTPGAQFMKTMRGGIACVSRVLDHLASGGAIVAAPQGRPFHYYVSSQWTVWQTLSIQRHVQRRICESRVRPEIVRDYWSAATRDDAVELMKQTLLELVYRD